MLTRCVPRMIDEIITPYFRLRSNSFSVFPAHEESAGILKSLKCRSRSTSFPAYCGAFSPRYSWRISLERRFCTNVRSITIDCFLRKREAIIPNTARIATPTMMAADAWNKFSMIVITNTTAMATRSRMIKMSGARLKRLSLHNALNSMEWFFFIIMARRNGAINSKVRTAHTTRPQKSPITLMQKGDRKCRQSMVMAIYTTENIKTIRRMALTSFFQLFS